MVARAFISPNRTRRLFVKEVLFFWDPANIWYCTVHKNVSTNPQKQSTNPANPNPAKKHSENTPKSKIPH